MLRGGATQPTQCAWPAELLNQVNSHQRLGFGVPPEVPKPA